MRRERRITGSSLPSAEECWRATSANVEFSHHGDDCTFETLVKRFGIADKAALKIAEMVHDADLEDGKFQRPECLGINAVLSGWGKTNVSDVELLDKGIE